ncbi:MAG: hypothetical protein ABR611_04135 [Chthoniobacterales bacterium]
MNTTEPEPSCLTKPRIPIDVNADCQSIFVNARAPEVYRRLLRFEDLPRFLTSILNITNITTNGFSCTSLINGEKIQSDVLIMMRVPDRRIAWQALSDQFRVGVVFLDPLLGGGTKVTVKVRSILEPLQLTGALRHYLRNFKRLIEEDLK